MKLISLFIIIGIGIVPSARAQTYTSTGTQKLLNAIQSSNLPPADCAAPQATVDMMNDIQEAVGNQINDQLVNLTDIKTLSIDSKTGDWSCEVTTVWATGPAVRGIFKLYYNVNLQPVYSWDGEEAIYNQSP